MRIRGTPPLSAEICSVSPSHWVTAHRAQPPSRGWSQRKSQTEDKKCSKQDREKKEEEKPLTGQVRAPPRYAMQETEWKECTGDGQNRVGLELGKRGRGAGLAYAGVFTQKGYFEMGHGAHLYGKNASLKSKGRRTTSRILKDF